MPELPEVEITRQGISPITGHTVTDVIVRNSRLRWPVPKDLGTRLTGNSIKRILRRGKYLLIDVGKGWLIIHLGMSGSLRIVASGTPAGIHDHFDLVLGDLSLRLRDPRRFGAVLWSKAPEKHALLAHLGAEPLSDAFSGELLYQASRRRKASIKQLVMDHTVVVGVGNIYANESLYRAGISPMRQSGRISRLRYERLAQCIRETIGDAIKAGGSSLRDFFHSDGSQGYFQQQYFVYGRAGMPCRTCGSLIRLNRTGQRSTFSCPACQT